MRAKFKYIIHGELTVPGADALTTKKAVDAMLFEGDLQKIGDCKRYAEFEITLIEPEPKKGA